MASNPTLSADPAAIASDAIGSGSSGAVETMDDVLGIGESGTDVAIADQDAPEVVVPEESEVTEQPSSQEVELDLRTTPQWIRDAIKGNADPKVQAQIRQAWNQLQAFRQPFKTPAEARQLSEAVQQAGGIERVRELVESDADYAQRDAAFFSGDPAQQEPLIVEWLQHDPNACYQAFQVTSDLLKRNFPEEFNAYSTGIARDTLDALSDGDFAPFMDSFAKIIAGGDANALQRASEMLAAWWGKASGKLGYGQQGKLDANQPNPAEQRISRERERLASEQRTFYQAKWQDFKTTFRTNMEQKVSSLARQVVDKSYERAKLSDAARQRIADDLANEVCRAVTSASDMKNQIRQLVDPSGKNELSDYRMSEATRSQIVNLLVQRSRSVLPGVAKAVFGRWTEILLGERKNAIQTRQSAARRADVSGGAPARWGKSGTLTREEASKMSMDQILSDDRPMGN